VFPIRGFGGQKAVSLGIQSAQRKSWQPSPLPCSTVLKPTAIGLSQISKGEGVCGH
jgi:hypothetical protein